MSHPFRDLVETSRSLAATRSRRAKVDRLADLLQRLAPEEAALAAAWLSGELPQGRPGVGPATLRRAFPDAGADRSTLTVSDVDAAFDRIAAAAGPGSVAERTRELRTLLTRATAYEQEFLARLVLGELRQGALEGIMAEAIARATDADPTLVRRAAMLAGDLTAVARAAFGGGVDQLQRFQLRVFRPLQPMLAQTAEDVDEALNRLGRAAFEYKLDGARIQVHRSGAEIRVFTRRLNDVTGAVPEVVEAVRRLSTDEVVLDGEAIALRSDGRPRPFQETMRRFGRTQDVARMREEIPLDAFFFDCLQLDGETLIDRPTEARFATLARAVPSELIVPRLVTDDPEAAADFLDQALAAGHEGVMAKALDAPYEAGGRGRAWLKVKPVQTLDLVVLAAEWGHGRRRGWLSNLHLGARDPGPGDYVMLGKTFKGLKDQTLEWQTKRLLELELSDDGHTVRVRPQLVVEIAFNDIQESSRYPGGLALRFARVVRYRLDKGPEDADTIDTVRRIYEG